VIRTRPSISSSPPLALRRLLGALLCIGVVAAPLSALAAEETEEDGDTLMYMEYMAGVSHVPNQTIRGTNASSIQFFGSTRPEDAGYFFGGAFGFRVGGNIRTELQVGYRNSEVEDMSVQGEPSFADDSTVSLFSVMANGYYDFELPDLEPVTPWVGFGIGWGMPRLDGRNASGPNQLSVDDTDGVFVYNAMAGITLEVSDTTDLTLGYRYIATTDFDVRGTQSGLLQRFEYEFDAHEAYVGIRFNFD